MAIREVGCRGAMMIGGAAALSAGGAFAQEPPKPASIVVNLSGGAMGAAMREMSVPQQQAVYASELGYPGLNLEALNFVDSEVIPYLPTQYLEQQFWVDDSWYAENDSKALELWNAWKLKKI